MLTATKPESFADFTLPGGCMLCGADLEVRVSPGAGAHSYCSTCHWLSRPLVQMAKEGLTVSYASSGIA